MTIRELQEKLNESHTQFIHTIRQVADADFTRSVNNKWTAGQQLEHIIKSVAPVNLALRLPRVLLRLAFGKANRPSRTYDQLVEKYRFKLSQGGRAPSRFVPRAVALAEREELINTLSRLMVDLNKKLDGFSEAQLDLLLLPHPLLGKLTLREMMYFTVYHAGHHEKQVSDNLK